MPIGTPGFVPERLRQARDARRITSNAALARHLGVNPSTVHRWDEGVSAPDSEAMTVLADRLHVRQEFFLRPVVKHDRPTFLRSFKAARVQDRNYQQVQMKWLQEISHAVEQYVDFPEVNVPDLMGNKSYQQLDEDDLEQIAHDLRDHWEIGDGPCPDVISLMERMGFIIGVIEMGTTMLDGLCSWSPHDGRPHVLLASDKHCFSRSQFDAAHEMAHAILHRNVPEEELVKNLPKIEAQAFRLASAFLLPPEAYAAEVSIPSLPAMKSLKDRWKVSIKAQIGRLRDLEILSKDSAVNFYKSYSAKGWNKCEPYDDLWEPTQPRVLKEAISLVVDEGVRTRSDLMNYDFVMSSGDVENLANLPYGWFSQKPAEIVSLKRDSSISAKIDRAAQVLEFNPNGKI